MHFVWSAIRSQNHTPIQFSLTTTNIFDAFSSFSPATVPYSVPVTAVHRLSSGRPLPLPPCTALIAPRRTIKLNGGPALVLGPRVAAGLSLGSCCIWVKPPDLPPRYSEGQSFAIHICTVGVGCCSQLLWGPITGSVNTAC